MARKINAWKASQAARAQAAVTNRQPAPPTDALYLRQVRPQPLKVPPPQGKRLQIAVETESRPETPRVVKIIHTD